MKQIKLLTLLSLVLVTVGARAITYTASNSGNWTSSSTWSTGIAPSNNLSTDDVVIPAGVTVTLDIDVSLNGLLAGMQVNGTLLQAAGKKLNVAQGSISGDGMIFLEDATFSGLSSITFGGTAVVNVFRNSSLNLTIVSTMSVKDTLILSGGGLVVSTGGTLEFLANMLLIRDNGTLTANGGSLITTNVYDVAYTGTSKTSGAELSGTKLTNVIVGLSSNNETLTLGSDVSFSNLLGHNSGMINLNGKTLSIGNYSSAGAGGMLMGTVTSNLIIKSNTSTTSPIVFAAGSRTLKDLEIDIVNTTAQVDLTSDLAISGVLKLHNGKLNVSNNAKLSMQAGSEIWLFSGKLAVSGGGTFEGFQSYNVVYSSPYNSGPELTGTGLNNLTLIVNGSPTDSVQINNSITVNGVLRIDKGVLDLNGYNLELKNDISFMGNAAINGDAGSSMVVTGSLTDTLMFVGDTRLASLTVNTSDSSAVLLGSSLSLNNLTFIKGRLTILNNDLKITSTGTISGYAVNRYIRIMGSGEVIMNVTNSSYTMFPIGLDTYSPLSVKISTGTAGDFKVNVVKGMWSQGTVGSGYDIATNRSVIDRSWSIVGTTGSNADVMVEWTVDAEKNGFARGSSYITHYSANKWDVLTPANATLTTAGTYQLSRSNVSAFGQFAVVDNNANVGINDQVALNAEMYPNPVKDQLTIRNTNESAVIEMLDITGHVIRVDQKSSPAAHILDLSKVSPGIYYIRVTSNDQQMTQKIVKL